MVSAVKCVNLVIHRPVPLGIKIYLYNKIIIIKYIYIYVCIYVYTYVYMILKLKHKKMNDLIEKLGRTGTDTSLKKILRWQ